MTPAALRRRALVALTLVALALAVAGNAAADSYTADVLADQPVAYWRLGELGGLTAFDSAPWHYDAQLSGTTPTAGALYTDPGNGAQSLDGTSKIVSAQDWSWLGGAPAQGGVRNHSFSLEFWMKPAVIDSRYLWVISEQDKSPVRQGWAVMLTQQPGQPVALSYERWADGGYVGGVVYRNDNAALKNAIDVGKWTHVLVNYDGDTSMGGQNKLRLYVNGVLVHTTTAQPANMVQITQPFRAGQGDDPSSQPGFVGAIDELALYGGAVWDAATHYKAAFIAPQNTVAPTFSGTAARGQTLTASSGTWTGGPAPTLALQWQRCAADGTSCAAIPGANGTSYTIADADAGSTLRLSVTGANGGGSVTVATPVSALVHGAAPTVTAAPSISGSGAVGDQLTASSGSWSGVPAPTFGYQWQRCNAAGALCSDLPGATSPTYTPAVTDAGAKLVVRVTATNFEGSASAVSTPFAVAASTGNGGSTVVAPAGQAAPTISGTPTEGATLTADNGTWSGSPTGFAYQWRRCGATCADIAGANASTYKVQSADIGSNLAVVVTATNAGGSGSMTSATTAPVAAAYQAPAAPAVTTAPSISGQALEGATVTADPGTWSGTPTSFAYQWRRCASTCADVAGANAPSYALGSADVGATLVVVVTATGPGGSASATSAAFGPVAASAPEVTALPTVFGPTVEGSMLNVSAGAWSGANVTYAYTWQRCDATCVDVGTGTSYTLGAADVGFAFQAVVTATNAGGSRSATSGRTAKVVSAAPVSTAAPVVSGSTTVGSTLSATAGSWKGSNLTFAYQWQRCGAACTDVATGSSYTVGAADVGSTLQVVVTATNESGSATAQSAQTAAILPAAPVSTAAPVVSGSAVEGATLSATAGDWTGSGLTYAYQWKRCDATCVDVGTGPSYALGAADVGSALQVVVTATNAGGSATAQSAQTTKVVPAAPVSTAAPVVSGATVVGSTLTATAGAWTGSNPTYAYQWKRCGTTCVDVATGPSYTLGAADVGSTLRVDVTATNAGGSATAQSAQTAEVVPAAPVSTAAPVVSGSAVQGETLTATAGSWNGSNLSYAYQWKRCDATCVDVATGSTYLLGAADVGSALQVVVTATNTGGSATAQSAQTAKVLPAAPEVIALPTVFGPTVEGSTLNVSAGAWLGADLTYSYKWQRCDATCVDVGSGVSYPLGAADVGFAFQVVVTATNAGGSASARSERTAKVVPAAPVAQAVPAVSGAAVAGSTLTATQGTWTGSGLGYGYQWKRCAADGSCTDIAGATAATYVLTAADVDASVAVTVTATNAGGTAVATSNVVGPVKAAAPVSKAAPAVTGTPVDGQTLTATTGTWDGTGPLAYAYQWQRCTGTTCTPVPDATAATYAVTAADAGSTLRVVVTATNAAGSASAPSVATAPVAGLVPANTVAPSVAGTAAIGKTLSATAGTWNGTAPLTTTYQWQRCATTCTAIAGATDPTYVVQAADYNAALRVAVTAKNAAGTATATSPQTAAVGDTIAPTLAISSVATGGITIAGWNVSLLLSVTVTASDAESGLAADPTCTVDGRAATLKDAGDGAWTLSVLNLGSHAVACAVTDKAGNRATASATVKPGGARELEQSLLGQVNKALASATPRDAARLAKVAASLSDALAAANWVDSNHVTAAHGRDVFDDNQDAAGVIVDLIKDRQSQVPDATSVSWLLTIAQVDRVLAATAVADAISAKTAKGKTDDAKDELDKSDTAAVKGDTTSALTHFENAWRKAQK